MKALVKISAILIFLQVLTACSGETTLQEYIVEKQKDTAFVNLDLAGSMLAAQDKLNSEQAEIFKSVKKVNIIALQLNENNRELYEAEKYRLATILSDEKYQPLIKYGNDRTGATLKFTGEVDAIDELIVFATDEERGLAVFRLLGDDLEPGKVINLMSTMNKEDVNLSFLKQFETAFN